MSFRSKKNVLVPAEFETEEQRDLYDWMYDITRQKDLSTAMWGAAMWIAGEHPDLTFWQVVAETKLTFTRKRTTPASPSP
jgi:hypothetical protein